MLVRPPPARPRPQGARSASAGTGDLLCRGERSPRGRGTAERLAVTKGEQAPWPRTL